MKVFRSAIDASFLQQLQDWLICSLPTFLALGSTKSIWSLTIVFLSATINQHLMKLFPLAVATGTRIVRENPTIAADCSGQSTVSHFRGHELSLFITTAIDFYAALTNDQQSRFSQAFEQFRHIPIYSRMLDKLKIIRKQ